MPSNSHHNAAQKTQNWAEMLTFCPLLCTHKCPLSITLPFSLTKVLPCYQSAFDRRTSGHCLGTFRAAQFSDFPSPLIIRAVPRTAPPHPSLLLSVLHVPPVPVLTQPNVGHNAALQTQNLTKVKIHPQCSTSSICCIVRLSISHHITFITSQRSTLLPAYL
jgi:hypothetical protein